jgi:nucleoside-diphosphate-sugar epimerase
LTFVVTGASGFLGRAVVEELLRRKQPVMAASRRKAVFDPGVRTLQIADYADLDPGNANSILIHLAEPRDIGAAQVSGDGHVEATQRLLRALLARAWTHAIYISSVAVHGGAPGAERSIYGTAKAECEREILAHGGGVVRLTNLYGPGMAGNNVLSDILSQVPGSGPLRVRDTGPVRDYLWVGDAARGVADAAQQRLRGAVDLGTGRGISVGELAHMVLAIANERDRPVVATAPQGKPSELIVNTASAAERLGWKAATGLEQGLAALMKRAQ